MKTTKIIFLLILILGSIFFVLDRQLFYYGKNDFNFYHLLPLKIKPNFRYVYEGGFAIEDNYDFGLIAKKFKYQINDENIEVDEILKYGFNNEELVAQIKDVNGNNYFIKCAKNNNKKSKSELSLTVWNEKMFLNSEKYKWIEIKNNNGFIEKIEIFRYYISFIIIVLFLFLIYKILKTISLKLSLRTKRNDE